MRWFYMLLIVPLAVPAVLRAAGSVTTTDDVTLNVSDSPLGETPGASSGPEYLVLFTDLTGGGVPVDPLYYYEINVQLDDSYKILIEDVDTTGNSVTVSDAGYFLSPSMIPLDQLNTTDEPPTGSSGSPFIPLPNLDGTYFPTGDTSDVNSRSETITTPLPATGWMALAGLGCIGGVMSMRRRAAV
jgi:hypothetical protein